MEFATLWRLLWHGPLNTCFSPIFMAQNSKMPILTAMPLTNQLWSGQTCSLFSFFFVRSSTQWQYMCLVCLSLFFVSVIYDDNTFPNSQFLLGLSIYRMRRWRWKTATESINQSMKGKTETESINQSQGIQNTKRKVLVSQYPPTAFRSKNKIHTQPRTYNLHQLHSYLAWWNNHAMDQ